jgi:EF hand
MRVPTRTSIISLCVAGLIAGCGGGGSSSGPELSVIDKGFLGGIASYDANHDDVVTCEEWRNAAARLFTRADKAGKGVLTEADFATLGQIDRTFIGTFQYFDANHDGKVEKKEFVDRPNPAFTYADKNKDCKLTELELATARNLSAPPPVAAAKATDPNIPSAGPGGGGSRPY